VEITQLADLGTKKRKHKEKYGFQIIEKEELKSKKVNPSALVLLRQRFKKRSEKWLKKQKMI
jgi:hypothetical protein